MPKSGDVTSDLAVYDAGTEEDTEPGTGAFQKPIQEMTEPGKVMNIGPAEDENIELASTRHPSFTIPTNNAVIKVTIAAQ